MPAASLEVLDPASRCLKCKQEAELQEGHCEKCRPRPRGTQQFNPLPVRAGDFEFVAVTKNRCMNPSCGAPVRHGKFRCDQCERYKRQHGTERPKTHIQQPPKGK